MSGALRRRAEGTVLGKEGAVGSVPQRSQQESWRQQLLFPLCLLQLYVARAIGEAGTPGGSGPGPLRPSQPHCPGGSQVAHLLEVAPLHGAVLHLPEVHVAKVVCQLLLEGAVSARPHPPPAPSAHPDPLPRLPHHPQP